MRYEEAKTAFGKAIKKEVCEIAKVPQVLGKKERAEVFATEVISSARKIKVVLVCITASPAVEVNFLTEVEDGSIIAETKGFDVPNLGLGKLADAYLNFI